jgi:hypothetical protein
MSYFLNPLNQFPKSLKKKIKAIFFDIDDTFSGGPNTHKIIHEAYRALWDLKNKGMVLVPVTGRPAGWCDLIARMWPVDAVIGENGAFYMKCVELDNHLKLKKIYLENEKIRMENKKKLQNLKKNLIKKFPKIKFASDQNYREFDLAIDIREDVKEISQKEIQKILDFVKEKKATAKLSSIHLNVWYGNYNKLDCLKKFLKNEQPKLKLEEIVYIGDSPNDAPFFEALPVTIGVSNIKKFLNLIKTPPKFITQNPQGLGFCEFANFLLKK